MTNVAPPLPEITALLQSKGRNTIGHETNLARSPIWQSRPHRSADDTIVTPVLFGHPFRKVEGRCLTTSDQRLFAHLTTAFVTSGCPESRQVPFSLGDAAILLGHDTLGGRQRLLVRSSLARLRSVTFESALRHPDGNHTVLGWGLIDTYLVTTKGGGKGWVKLSEPVTRLLREGSVTFLHAPTWRAICAEDEVAGRLWSFLESETIGSGWRYSLFASEAQGKQRSIPAVADILQLPWSVRRRVVARVREACAAIEAHDRRYRLTVDHGRAEGSWFLSCSRTQGKRTPARAALPAEVVATWRRAYHSHQPSQRQRDVLVEVLGRHPSEWVVDQLECPCDDPFGQLLAADRAYSRQAVATALDAEAKWDEAKQTESATAEQSLAELIGIVRRHAVAAQSH